MKDSTKLQINSDQEKEKNRSQRTQQSSTKEGKSTNSTFARTRVLIWGREGEERPTGGSPSRRRRRGRRIWVPGERLRGKGAAFSPVRWRRRSRFDPNSPGKVFPLGNDGNKGKYTPLPPFPSFLFPVRLT